MSESEIDTNENNSNGPFRVRNVSEINSDSQKKRRLPIWLNLPQQETSSDNKRQRIEEDLSCSKNNVLEETINDKENRSTDEFIKLPEQTNYSEVSAGNLESLNETQNKKITNNNRTETIKPDIPEDENSSPLPLPTDKLQNENSSLPTDKRIENLSFPQNGATDKVEESPRTNSSLLPIKVEIKEEKEEIVSSTAACSTSTTTQNTNQTVKEEPSSTTRESCKFGIRCYRRNPQHRIAEAHPGDSDYRRPNYPAPPKGTPDCPFGDLCYRRNPSHFKDFSHPPSTDFKKNWQNQKRRLRDRKTKINNSVENDDLDENEYDLMDDFIDDCSDDEYVPTDDD